MPLLSSADLQTQKNITLEPNGIALADTLATAILAWSANFCNRASWDYGTYTEDFDGAHMVYYLANTPLDTAQPVAVSSFNISTQQYDAYTGTIQPFANGAVKIIPIVSYPFGINSSYPFSYASTRIQYTGGYQTLPADLKQALVELLARRFDAASDGGRQLIKMTAGRYAEEYAPTDDVPEAVMAVLRHYRNMVVW